MTHKRWLCLILATVMLFGLLLSGCSLERGYSSVEPHENRYWESNDNDILRAESYQDFVNAILLLVEQHEETGTIRLYLSDVDYSTALTLVKNACTEVREDTATGSYCLETLGLKEDCSFRFSIMRVLMGRSGATKRQRIP